MSLGELFPRPLLYLLNISLCLFTPVRSEGLPRLLLKSQSTEKVPSPLLLFTPGVMKLCIGIRNSGLLLWYPQGAVFLIT